MLPALALIASCANAFQGRSRLVVLVSDSYGPKSVKGEKHQGCEKENLQA